jgi:hypothetical protein
METQITANILEGGIACGIIAIGIYTTPTDTLPRASIIRG